MYYTPFNEKIRQMNQFDIVKDLYPTIYISVYEIVANSMAANCTYLKTPMDFTEQKVEDKLRELFEIQEALGVKDDLLVHCWFRACCLYAANQTGEIIETRCEKN